MASSSRRAGSAPAPSGVNVGPSFEKEQSARHRIEDLAGVKAEHARCLHLVGLLTVESFLENARSPRDRMFLAAKSGLSARQILEILNLADLSRIDNLGYEAIRILRSHGVHTSKDLAELDPAFLISILSSQDDEGAEDETSNIAKLVYCWIAQARELPSLTE